MGVEPTLRSPISEFLLSMHSGFPPPFLTANTTVVFVYHVGANAARHASFSCCTLLNLCRMSLRLFSIQLGSQFGDTAPLDSIGFNYIQSEVTVRHVSNLTCLAAHCVIAKRTRRVAWARDCFALGRLLHASILTCEGSVRT